MAILLATAAVFAVVVLAMSLGVMFTGRSLKGSCGGVGGNCPCSDSEKQVCPRRKQQAA
ncbi:MAG: DUF539 domain-containing protein [Myxococcales bacterium]|nr:DUF539 domain-containing protein [Myxococcales bacterium]